MDEKVEKVEQAGKAEEVKAPEQKSAEAPVESPADAMANEIALKLRNLDADTGAEENGEAADVQKEVADEKKPEEKESAEQKSPEIDAETLKRGRELGLSYQEISEVAAAPKWMIERYFADFEEPSNDDERAVGGAAPVEQKAPVKTDEKPKAPEKEAPAYDWAKIEKKLSEEYEPEIAEAFKALRAEVEKKAAPTEELQELREQVSQLYANDQQRAAMQLARELDTVVVGLPKEWQEVIGTEPFAKTTDKSKYLAPRTEFVSARATIMQRRAALGLPELSESELAVRALNLAFPEKADAFRKAAADADKKKGEDELKNKLRDQKGKFVPRPSPRKATEPVGEEAMVGYIKERLQAAEAT